jgi:(+)-trans-carveol dehydrogenase
MAPLVFITGASSGIGQALAWRYYRAGWRLALVARRGAEMREWAEEKGLTFGRWQVYPADVADVDSIAAAAEVCMARQGVPDVVIANAGISGTPSTAALIDENAWQTMLDINLTGVMHTTKVALPHMMDGRGGSIILVSSMLGLRGGGYMAAYASAKHAVVGLMNSLANELAHQWIRVNSIHPGNILTPMIDNDQFRRTLRPDLDEPTMDDAAQVIGHFHMLPKPVIEARAVSDAVLFLASDESKYITGAALPIDAGAVAKF